MTDRNKLALLWVIAIAGFVWSLLAMAVNVNQADTIRDLQLRVVVLEQRQ
jgi:hypothetical protein